MADTKISALPASTTPLAGTEVLPIVQSGTTKQVSVANLTASRAISAAELTLSTGNLVIGTSGKGVDFSATPGTGTSELLADYEEGTWTPTDGSGVGLTFTGTNNNCFYTKVGNVVTCVFALVYPSTASAFAAVIAGLPFTSKNTDNSTFGGYTTYNESSLDINFLVASGGTTVPLYLTTGSVVTNVQMSARSLRGVIIYTV